MADFVVAGVDIVTDGSPAFEQDVGDGTSRINGTMTSGPTTSVYNGPRLETSNGVAKPAGGNLGVRHFGGSHTNSAPHHEHMSHGPPSLVEDLSDHRNVYKTYKEYIGFGKVNREGVQGTFNVRDKATNTNTEGVPDHAGGQKMLLNSVNGEEQAEKTETIESFESKGSQTFHDDGPRNNGEIHVYEHHTGHGRDPDLYVPPSHEHLNVAPSHEHLKVPPSHEHLNVPPSHEHLKVPPSHDHMNVPPSHDHSKVPPSHEHLKVPPSHEHLKVPPSHDQPHEPPAGTDETKWVVTDETKWVVTDETKWVVTDETKWVVTDALANVRGACPVNKPRVMGGTPSLTSIHITQIKVMPRPPSRVGNREDGGPSRVGNREDGGPSRVGNREDGGPSRVGNREDGGPSRGGNREDGGPSRIGNREDGGKRKRAQKANRQDTERDVVTIKRDGELRDDDIKGNGSEVAGTSCKQGQSGIAFMGARFELVQKEMNSQGPDKKEHYGNEDVSQNINIAKPLTSALVSNPPSTKTSEADRNSSTLAEKNQVANKIIRAASCVPRSFSVSRKPRPKTSCLKSSDSAMDFDVRHLNATALHVNQDVYNAFARATPPRRPLSRQNSLPGPGQHKPFISIYDRPFSRRELRQALPRKSFFSCHDKVLKDVELAVNDSPIRSKPGRRKTQLEYQAGESAQSFPKVADHTPENRSQQISNGLEESKTRISSERSNDVNAPPKEATGTPATDSVEIAADASKEVFHVGESRGFKSPTPIFQKRKPQSAKSGGAACTPLTEYLEYVKENRQEFLRYQESLKRESPANARLIKLGQVYALRHQGGVARQGCDDVLVLAAKTLRPRSERVNRQKEPVVRSAGSCRKPGRMSLDDRRPREKTPGPGAAVGEDEFGKSELERRKARAEEWAWSISSHKLAKAKLESLRELGSEDRELTAWWEEFKDCQYLRTVHI